MHVVGVETEAVAHDLLVDGLVPLALGDAAREQRDRAGLVEADFGAFEPAGRRALDGVGDADAGELAALARLRRAASRSRATSESSSAMSMLFSNSPLS